MITYLDIIKELSDMKEGDSFVSFSEKILKTNLKIIGVKVPNIKKIIKKYKNEEVLNFNANEYYETNLIFLCIGLSNQKSIDDIYLFITSNKNLIDSWALTDTSFKYAKLPKSFKEASSLIDKLLNYDDEFAQRYGYLFLFEYLKDKENINEIFSKFKNTNYFYVLMAEAWAISYLFVYHFDETYKFIKESDLDLELKLKSISKGIDSFRISKENKMILKELRKYLKSETNL